MGISFGAGIQFLLDSHQKFVRAGKPIWLRVKNFEDEGDYIEVGVPYVPTGGPATAQTGYTDILIDPPPDVKGVSLHNIGLNSGRLQFGATQFIVSNSFVDAQLAKYREITDPIEVFRNRDGYAAIGIFYFNRLYSIESITHKEVSGQTIVWYLICNALETVSDSLSHSPDE